MYSCRCLKAVLLVLNTIICSNIRLGIKDILPLFDLFFDNSLGSILIKNVILDLNNWNCT